MSTIMARLEAIRDALSLIAGVSTCKIGLEKNITPEDYPMIRIVPASVTAGQFIGRSKIDVIIYFGMPIQDFDADPDGMGRVRLEKLYAALFELHDEIDSVITDQNCIYTGLVTDEDRLDTYKLMAIKCDVTR